MCASMEPQPARDWALTNPIATSKVWGHKVLHVTEPSCKMDWYLWTCLHIDNNIVYLLIADLSALTCTKLWCHPAWLWLHTKENLCCPLASASNWSWVVLTSSALEPDCWTTCLSGLDHRDRLHLFFSRRWWSFHMNKTVEREKIAELYQKTTMNFQHRMGTVEISKGILVKLEMALWQ